MGDRVEGDSLFVEVSEHIAIGQALEETRRHLERLPGNPYAWRWALAAAHAAIQATAVAALTGPAKIGAMPPRRQEKWLAAYAAAEWSKLPDDWTDDFLPLYERLKSELNFPTSDAVDEEIRRLHGFRNWFGHIRSTALLIWMPDLPDVLEKCLTIPQFLMENGAVLWVWDEQRTRAERELGLVLEQVSRLQSVYAEN